MKRKVGRNIIYVACLLLSIGCIWYYHSLTDVKVNESFDYLDILRGYVKSLNGYINEFYNVNGYYPSRETVLSNVSYSYPVSCGTVDIFNDGNIYVKDCLIDNVGYEFSFGEKEDNSNISNVKDNKLYLVKIDTNYGTYYKRVLYSTLINHYNINNYYEITCESDSCGVYYVDSQYVIYYDNGVEYIYDYQNGKNKQILNRLNGVKPVYKDKELVGFILYLLQGQKYFDLNNNKIINNMYYEDIIGCTEYCEVNDDDTIVVKNDGKYGLLNSKDGGTVFGLIYEDLLCQVNYCYAKLDGSYVIMNTNGNKLVKDSYNDVVYLNKKGYYIGLLSNEYKLYNNNGNVIFNLGSKDNIKELNEYVMNNILYIKVIMNNSDVTNYTYQLK